MLLCKHCANNRVWLRNLGLYQTPLFKSCEAEGNEGFSRCTMNGYNRFEFFVTKVLFLVDV